MHFSHRAGAARRTEGAQLVNGSRPGRKKHDGAVRRCVRLQPARRGALWRASAQGTRTPVPLHHSPRDRRRATQARGCRAATQKRVARRHYAYQDVTAGIHAAPGRAGAVSAPAPDPLSRRAGAQCWIACRDRAGLAKECQRARRRTRARRAGAVGPGTPAPARFRY